MDPTDPQQLAEARRLSGFGPSLPLASERPFQATDPRLVEEVDVDEIARVVDEVVSYVQDPAGAAQYGLRFPDMLEREAKQLRHSLQLLIKDPRRYEPQRENAKMAISNVLKGMRSLERALGMR